MLFANTILRPPSNSEADSGGVSWNGATYQILGKTEMNETSIQSMKMPVQYLSCQESRLTYADGSSRTVYHSDWEVPFPEGLLIVSRTDLRGIITHANDAFIQISGYRKEELIGASHCVLRHPDMPKRVFGDLWQTISAGKKWQGYIKNLRKDGAHYWVFATVVPNIRAGTVVGYTSVRRQPAKAKLEAVIALYRHWIELEGETE